MFRWLNGPGAVFKDPIPGSTHYLNAYNKSGKLIRAITEGDQDEDEDVKTKTSSGEDEDEDSQSNEKNVKNPQAIPAEQQADLVPFPMNRQFRSQPVLSEELKDEIWKRIMVEGQSVKVVSASLQVEMRRVGAVIRLKAVENQWVEQVRCRLHAFAILAIYMMRKTQNRLVLKTISWLQKQNSNYNSLKILILKSHRFNPQKPPIPTPTNPFPPPNQGKRLATPYAKAMLSMLPKTPYYAGISPTPHESINDLPVHHATLTQTFHPVAESRHFTRADAGKVFARDLLPAEARIPHPELVEIEKLRLAGVDTKVRVEIVRDKMVAEEAAAEDRRVAKKEREAKALTRVVPLDGRGRAEFRFWDVSVESVGKDGKGRFGVGARYGVPPQDRKRGIIKIPTRVQ